MNKKWNSVKPSRCANWLVLPTVYSDALSYGEQLDKFCFQLNQLIENNNILPDFISEMIKEFINSGAIGEVVRDILADYILNVKYPPEGITPAVGDGTADDTAAIQGCIDYAAENGGVVYFPYGSYLTQSLTMKDGVSLFGFDRYSTKIVLKGGATKPLIGGTVADFSICNLTLDGNSGIQVNDVNVITIMATNVLLSNLIVKDGYTLMNYIGTGGHLQIDDIVFGNAVEKCFLTTGNANVQCNNVIFNQLSAVGGVSVMDIGTDGGYFNGVKSVATCNQCIVISGNNNKIYAIVENATTPVIDNGLQNNIEIAGVSNKEFFSDYNTKEVHGNYSKHVGGTYTKTVGNNSNESIEGNKSEIVNGNYSKDIGGTYTKKVGNNSNESVEGDKSEIVTGVSSSTYNGDRTITGKNITENTSGKRILNAQDIVLNPTNPLTYKTPTKLNDNFDYVPFKDANGNQYNVLVEGQTLPAGTSLHASDFSNSNSAVSGLLEVASTYYENRNNLVYGNFHTAFNGECTNEIDCSSFVMLCLLGVPYKNSRYNAANARNLPIAGYNFEEIITIDESKDRPYGMLAMELAFYANKYGMLYEIDKVNGDNIRPGDILFVCNSPHETYWNKIGHCAIIMGVRKYNKTLSVIGANNNGVAFETWRLDNAQVIYAARFPLADSEFIVDCISNTKFTNFPRTTQVSINSPATSQLIFNLYTLEPLKPHTMYTFVVKGSRLPNTHWGAYYLQNKTVTSLVAFGDVYTGHFHFISVMTNNEIAQDVDENTGMYATQIRLIAESATITGTINTEYAELYEGVLIPKTRNEVNSTIKANLNSLSMKATGIGTDAELETYLKDRANGRPDSFNFDHIIVTAGLTNLVKGSYNVLFACNGTYGVFLILSIDGKTNAKMVFYSSTGFKWYDLLNPTVGS